MIQIGLGSEPGDLQHGKEGVDRFNPLPQTPGVYTG